MQRATHGFPHLPSFNFRRTFYLNDGLTTNLGVNNPATGVVLGSRGVAITGFQKTSAALTFQAQGWDTNVPAQSKTKEVKIYLSAGQGATGFSSLYFDFFVNAAGFGSVYRFGSGGTLSFNKGTNTGTGVSSGHGINSTLSGASVLFYTGSSDLGDIAIATSTGTSKSVIFLPSGTERMRLTNAGALTFGGITSSFPSIQPNSTLLEVLAADAASNANLAVYNTKVSGTNFERLDFIWAANVAQIWTEKGSGGGTARDLALGRDATEVVRMTSTGFQIALAKTLIIPSGTDQRAGNAVLVGGTVTVANTTVTANSVLMLTRKTSGGTIGTAITYTVIAATSFTITSDSVLDTSTFSYFIIEVP